MGKKVKKIARIALPILGTALAPGIGTALGSTLGSATLSGIGGAIGGGLGGGIGGGGFKGALTGAALGGAGGYLSGGGFSDLFGSTSLSSPSLNSFMGGPADAATGAARMASSGAASEATRLPWQVGSGGGAAAGGGSSGGFFSGLADKATNSIGNALSTDKLVSGGLKYGLSSALNQDTTAGLPGVGAAANEMAGYYEPFRAGGTAAQDRLSGIYGFSGPEAQQAAFSQFQVDPGYQFARNEGINALDASAARRGMLSSGNQERAVQEYGTDLANKQFQQYLANLNAQAGRGYDAAGAVGNARLDAAQIEALRKADRARRSNQLTGGFASALFG